MTKCPLCNQSFKQHAHDTEHTTADFFPIKKSFFNVEILLYTALQVSYHSALMRNLMKVWKTWTGPSRGGRAWSRGPKSALSKILQNKEHF